MSRNKGRFPAITRAALKSAGRSGAVIKARNPNIPAIVPDRPLHRDRTPQPRPLNESDLDLTDQTIHFLGCLTAEERGAQGNVTLDVLLHPDGSCEVGPFQFARPQVVQLLSLIHI